MERCQCGIYAAKALVISVAMASDPVAMASDNPRTIVGRVELAGKVIEHDGGYRAELARVVELLPRPGQESAAEWIAHVYGVPVSHDLVRMWGSFSHVSPPNPVLPSTRVVQATKPPSAPTRRMRRRSQRMPMPARRRTIASRIGVALFALAISSFLQSLLGLSSKPNEPPATTNAVPVSVLAPAHTALVATSPPRLSLMCPNADLFICSFTPIAAPPPATPPRARQHGNITTTHPS